MKRLFALLIVALTLICSCGKIDTSAIEARLDTIEKVSIASLQSQISQINTTIGNLQATQSQLSGFVATLQTSVGTLEGNYSSLNTDVENLSKQDAKFEKDIADLAKAVDDCGKDVKKWVEESYTTLTKFSELQEEVSTIKTNIQTIFSRLDGLDTETKRISDGLSDLATELNEKLGKCEGEIEGIKKDLKALQDDMDTVKAQIAAIVSSVQSVVVVPDYSDGSVKLSKVADNKVRFVLYPLEAAESIAKTGPSILSLDYVETQTKSSEDFVNLPIIEVTFTGKTVLLTVDGTGLPNTIIEGTKTASACLRISDGIVTRSSGFFPISLQRSGSDSQSSVDNAPLWLELPALRETPDCHFFTHDWDGGMYVSAEVSPKRNYSFYWDKNKYISHWVAYPLNKDLHSGGYGRYDDKEGGGFPADPILTNLGWAQPYLFGASDTYGGGWTRGHQIPSADRQVEKANMATFYVTNLTPQNYDMNGEVWAKLETSVRSWSDRCDTLYVCTGCHPGPSATGNKSGVNVSIPDYYYKALLRKKGEDYSMAAFKIANSASVATSGYMDFIISVSELESETGEVFFAALSSYISADKIAAIKSASPADVVSKW